MFTEVYVKQDNSLSYRIMAIPQNKVWKVRQSLISYFNTARLAPIEKLYSLHRLALVEDQNGIQILGLYRFVSEEFNYNVPNYISS